MFVLSILAALQKKNGGVREGRGGRRLQKKEEKEEDTKMKKNTLDETKDKLSNP